MSNFRKVLSFLASEQQCSWRLDGEDPTTEQEYLDKVNWSDPNNIIYWNQIQSELYKLNRLEEYPSIGDQLDSLFHAGVFPLAMAEKIQAIKDKYPKGGDK